MQSMASTFEYFFQWTSLNILSVYSPSNVSFYYAGSAFSSLLFQAARGICIAIKLGPFYQTLTIYIFQNILMIICLIIHFRYSGNNFYYNYQIETITKLKV